MKTILICLLLALTIFSVNTKDASRDFVKWMADVEDAGGRKGIAALVLNVNPSMVQADADRYAEELTEASKAYPEFCNTGNEDRDKAEFAAFLTIVGAETSFSTAGGFPCTKENGCPNCEACSYNDEGKICLKPGEEDKQYFGRGPLQLSWNYNYADFSEDYFNDRSYLTENPNRLTESGSRCWASAIWFWMEEHGFGGWCMPEAAWPGYKDCHKDCPNGPDGCEHPECTSIHWLTKGRASCHHAI